MFGDIAKGFAAFIALLAMIILSLCMELMHRRGRRPNAGPGMPGI